MRKVIKSILLSIALLPLLASAHTLTLVAHKNDQSLSSGTMDCIEHCKYLIKSYEYRNQGNCRLVEVKDGNRVVYRRYYRN